MKINELIEEKKIIKKQIRIEYLKIIFIFTTALILLIFILDITNSYIYVKFGITEGKELLYAYVIISIIYFIGFIKSSNKLENIFKMQKTEKLKETIKSINRQIEYKKHNS